jgi:hypothetical protein
LEGLKLSYELVWVNDDSRDATSAMIGALREKGARFVAIRRSRNFGQIGEYVCRIFVESVSQESR